VSERNVSPAAAEPPDPPPPAATGAIGVTDLRRLWPEVLDRVMVTRRFAWIMLSQNAQVHSVDGAVITIALVNAGARDSFARSGSDDVLRAAIVDVIGGDWRIETIVDPGTSPSPAGTESRSTSAATTTAPQAQNPATPERPSGGQSASTSCSEPRAAGSAQDADVDPDDPVVETVDVSHEDLLSDVLGAKVIEDHPPRP
jgi:DNA polymerase-3 subunit gamma/tau